MEAGRALRAGSAVNAPVINRLNQMATQRSKTLDVFRGLLFVLMANTHAMTLAGLDGSHWLMGHLWLPNGWATVVYVVLSGYGSGWIFSVRHPPALQKPLLRRRSAVILAVMVLSNSIFTMGVLAQQGDLSPVLTWGWWTGFITLDTPWSISGVLLPTALVLLCAPTMLRLCRALPYQTLAALVLAQLAVAVSAQWLTASVYAHHGAVRFFLTEGLGGFPVLPFVLNGCLGCWLGVYRQQNEPVWLYGIAFLLLLQLCMFASSFAPPALHWSVFRNTFGPAGKFAWLFLCAGMLARLGPPRLVPPIALIGKFALATFVAHRVFLQLLNATIAGTGLDTLPAELRYVALWIGTLALSWILCKLLQRHYNRAASAQLARPKVPRKEDYFTQ